MSEEPRGLENSKIDRSPLVSVITVNTNEKHRLEVLLPTLQESTGDFEVLISDNGSIDGTLQFLAESYPAVRIIANGTNLGFAAANNRAAHYALGEILVFLNPDTFVEPSWLEALVAPFADPFVGLTTAKLLLMQQRDCINTCGNDIHCSGLTLCRGMGQPRTSYGSTEDVAAVSGAAFAIRAALFRSLGGFDESFFIYVEETDLSLRARIAGWRCVYVPGSVVFHDYQFRIGSNKIFFQERNRYLMLLGNLKIATLIALVPVLVLAELICWVFVLLRDRSNWSNKFRAYYWVGANLPLIRAKRRRSMRLRRAGDRTLLRATGYRLDYGQVSSGTMVWIGHKLVDPIFRFWRWVSLVFVWW
jgi:GT2 family glycosyltransferase